MSFNPDLSKQAPEVLHTHKTMKTNQSNTMFNGNTVQNSLNQLQVPRA